MCQHGAYSFARSACSFFGSICSIAPLSSKIGYDAHIFAAQMMHSITIVYRSDLEIRRREFDADSRKSIRFAPLMPLCIDDFT